MIFIFDAFFWPLGQLLARAFKPVNTMLDDLESSYQEFCKTHQID